MWIHSNGICIIAHPFLVVKLLTSLIDWGFNLKTFVLAAPVIFQGGFTKNIVHI